MSPGSSPGRAARLGAPSNQAAALTPPDGGGPPNAVPARRPGPASPWSQTGRLGLRPQPRTGRLAERVPSKRPAVPGCCVSPMAVAVAVSTARRFAHRAGPRSTLTTWPERSPQGAQGCRRAALQGGRGPQGACPGARPARGEASSPVQSGVRRGVQPLGRLRGPLWSRVRRAGQRGSPRHRRGETSAPQESEDGNAGHRLEGPPTPSLSHGEGRDRPERLRSVSVSLSPSLCLSVSLSVSLSLSLLAPSASLTQLLPPQGTFRKRHLIHPGNSVRASPACDPSWVFALSSA